MRSIAWLALLLLTPAASALEINVDPASSFEIAPLEEGTISHEVVLRCQSYDEALGSFQDRVLTRVSEVETQGITVVGEDEFAIDDDLCRGQNEQTIAVDLTVIADHTAPGETPIQVTSTFAVVADGIEQASRTSTATFVVAWTGDFTVQQEFTWASGGPQTQLEFPVTITNHGNSRAFYTFELVGEQNVLNSNIVVPEQVILDSLSQGGTETTTTVHVLYATPFQNGETQANETFTLRVVSQSTKNPELQGEPQELSFTAETDGVYVPGPGMLAPLGIAAAALLRRRA